MKNHVEKYREIYDVLDNSNLDWTSTNHFPGYEYTNRYGVSMVNAPYQDILGWVFFTLKEMFPPILDTFANNTNLKSYLSRLPPGYYLDIQNSEKKLINIAKAVTVTSNISLFTTYQAIDWEDEEVVAIPHHLFFLLHIYRPLILNGMAIVLPSSFAIKSGGGFTESRMRCEDRIASPSRPLINITRFLSKDEIKTADFSTEMPMISIPTLRGVTLDDIVKIRNEHQGAFILFQNTFKQLINGSRENLERSDLNDVMEQVTIGVIKCEEEYRKIARQMRISGFDVAVGAIGMSMLVAGPPEWQTYVGAILGSKAVIDGIKWFATKKNAQLELKGNDYWFPWYLARKSNDLKDMK